jgi:hypothetical protein
MKRRELFVSFLRLMRATDLLKHLAPDGAPGQDAMTQASLDDSISALKELRAATQARWAAEERCRELYRERAFARARAAERDPNAALN